MRRRGEKSFRSASRCCAGEIHGSSASFCAPVETEVLSVPEEEREPGPKTPLVF